LYLGGVVEKESGVSPARGNPDTCAQVSLSCRRPPFTAFPLL
jgi:hypothetical protein